MKKNKFLIVLWLIALVNISIAQDQASTKSKPARLTPSNFSITFFPQEVYMNQNASFVLQGAPNSSFTVTMNGNKLGSYKFDLSGEHICQYKFLESGKLRFEQEKNAYEILLLSPKDKTNLKIEKGYLYNKDHTALLLVEHNKPPKHSRKWESVNAIKSLFGANKTTISNATVLGANFFIKSVTDEMKKLTAIQNWTQFHNNNVVNELDQMLIDIQKATHKEMLIVALSTRDMDRGLDKTSFRLRLEWFLQKANSIGFKKIYLISFPFNLKSFEKYSSVDQDIRLAANSNNATFIKHSFHKMKHPIAKSEWCKIIIDQISKEIEFK